MGRTSGILLKLRAFRLFLQQYEQYRDHVVLVLYIMSRGAQKTTPEHVAIAEQARELCLVINADFGFHVDLRETVDDVDRSALLCVTDVLLETSLKDGLNLVPFEYLAARDTWLRLEGVLDNIASGDTIEEEEREDEEGGNLCCSSLRKTGRIVISEFTGSSQVLQGAIRVNPWHIETILSALDEALTLPLAPAHASFVRDATYVASQSQVSWAREFSTQIVRAHMSSFSPEGTGPVPPSYAAIPRLNKETVAGAFVKAKTRVLFLDNEGTLAPNLSRMYRHYGSAPLADSKSIDLQSQGVGPSEDVLRILSLLCDDPNTYVVILSGRPKAALANWFAPVLSHGLGLAAEHGFHLKLPKKISPLPDDHWTTLIQDTSSTLTTSAGAEWTSLTEEIMNRYVNRTPNTYIEDKGSARVWQFRDAEADFGPAQAKELHAELEVALRTQPVDITTGKGYVEVKLRGVNKGVAIERVIHALEETHVVPDFILCIGDDRSDESMFEKLLLSPAPNVFTSTVGRKRTLAKYFISDVDHVSALLASLAGGQQPSPPSLTSSATITRHSSADPVR